MTEVRRYLVLDGFTPRLPEHGWIQLAHVYEGVLASDLFPSGLPWVRLVHPTDRAVTAIVPTTYLAELVSDGREG